MICRKKGKCLWYPKWFFVLFFWFLFVYWGFGGGGMDFLEKIKIFIEVFSLKLSNLVKWLDLFIKTDKNKSTETDNPGLFIFFTYILGLCQTSMIKLLAEIVHSSTFNRASNFLQRNFKLYFAHTTVTFI